MKLLNFIKFIRLTPTVGANEITSRERRKTWQLERKSLRYAKQKLRRKVR